MNDTKTQTDETPAGAASALSAGLGAKQTHGFRSTAQDGAAQREIDVALFDDGSYLVLFTTTWAANTNEPMVTQIKLSSAGFALLSKAIIEAALNMQNWPTPEAPNV